MKQITETKKPMITDSPINNSAVFTWSNVDDGELVLNIDDLIGIIDQLQAITLGYADDFICFEEETETRLYFSYSNAINEQQ